MRKSNKGFTVIELINIIAFMTFAGLGIALVVALIRFLLTH